VALVAVLGCSISSACTINTPIPRRMVQLHVLGFKYECSTVCQYIGMCKFAEGFVFLRYVVGDTAAALQATRTAMEATERSRQCHSVLQHWLQPRCTTKGRGTSSAKVPADAHWQSAQATSGDALQPYIHRLAIPRAAPNMLRTLGQWDVRTRDQCC
jgi:hypothetical protein